MGFWCIVGSNPNWNVVESTRWNLVGGKLPKFSEYEITGSLPYSANYRVLGNANHAIVRESYDWTYGEVPNTLQNKQNKLFTQTNAMSRPQVSQSKPPTMNARAGYGSLTCQQQSGLINAPKVFADTCSSIFNMSPRYKGVNHHEHVSRIGIQGMQLMDTCLLPLESRNPLIEHVGRITNPNYVPRMVERNILPMMDPFAIMYVLCDLFTLCGSSILVLYFGDYVCEQQARLL